MMRDLEQIREMAGDDGDSAPIGPPGCGNRTEVGQLLRAWSLERGQSNERSLVLDQLERFLRRELKRGLLPPGTARRARRLLRSIEIVATKTLNDEA